MKLPLKLNRNIARLLMAVVLLTQWALPASTYAAAPAAPAQVSVSSDMAAAYGMPCHDQTSGHDQASGMGACIAHCSQADQIRLDHAQLPAMPVSLAVWHVALPLAPALPGRVFAPAEPRPGASPPLPILYCSLLN